MSDSKQNRKINRFFAEFIAKLRKWLNKIGSPVRISRRLVRQLLSESRGQKKGGAAKGFVLPTVAMVTLLVTLLVVTTVSRSSERAQTASNARTEQVFRSAATPIIDRARAKIDALLIDDVLPRDTPAEAKLDSVFTAAKYTFSDETRLQLVYNFPTGTSNAIKIDGDIGEQEYVSTAWKLPIDTDNNGKFDSYGLYSILFRARPSAASSTRPVLPIESRALPMDETTLSSVCIQASSSDTNAASNAGWSLSSDNKLRKAFFVYSVTVPITDQASFPPASANSYNLYELYKGRTSISAVELQQDRARSPQNNNAVFFEGDLELVNPATFRINGRIYTAGSLMVGALPGRPITFYQVSSSGGSTATPAQSTTNSKLFGSCYYAKSNSEIVVAGQVVEGDALTTVLTTGNDKVNVDLFSGDGVGVPPDTVTGGRVDINSNNKSASNLSSKIALNDFAYNNRISALVDEAVRINGTISVNGTSSGSFTLPSDFSSSNLSYSIKPDPTSVREDVVKRIQDEALSSITEVNTARRAALTTYFSERTRRVNFGDVPFTTVESFTPAVNPILTRIAVTGKPDDLAPPIDWMLPAYTNANFGKAIGSYIFTSPATFDGRGAIIEATKGITLLNSTANRLNLAATAPDTVATKNESALGDRVLVGNGLPAKWLKKNDSTNVLEFIGSDEPNYISINTGNATGVSWDNPTGAGDRYRKTRSITLSSLGVTDRGGFWEISAALDPAVPDLANTTKPLITEQSPRTGGLRVVTNAGIYSRRPKDTFLPRFRTGIVDDTSSTSTWNESSMPLWNGQAINNPITAIDETKFAISGSPSATPPDPTVDGETETKNYVVWPDSMPMTGIDTSPTARKGDLQMRATAIYHYKYDAYNPVGAANQYQAPLACVSSYYDPTNAVSAKNAPFGTTAAPWNPDPNGRSNNGLVYKVGKTAADIDFSNITITDGVFGGFSDTARDPALSTASLKDRLVYQANLIFPNGRFANETLREVIKKLIATPTATLTLPQQSTLDANLCALQILDKSIVLANTSSTSATLTLATIANTATLTSAQVPHGAFRESAFLNGREAKSFNRNESLTEAAVGNQIRGTAVADNGLAIATPNRGDIYDLQLEQRQPLEIRSTDIDMDRLRGSKIVGGNNSGLGTDYLLPYSGLVYATREDALEDLSYYDKNPSTGNPIETSDAKRRTLSSTDFLIDPTRKPSSIRLINGYRIWRSSLTGNLDNVNGAASVSDTNYAGYPFNDTTRGEKGLALVSNLPVYIKAQFDPTSSLATPSFNKHTREEFTELLNEDISNIDTVWNNFYTRHANNSTNDKLDPNFACRPQSSTGCTDGDQWRPATVLADAVTVLSASYRDGYRTDGDYDLRNNSNTSTSINWQSQLNPNTERVKDSSYVLNRRRNGFFNNNFVTSSLWLSTKNSDDGTGSSSNLWLGTPESGTNGNLSSYNANGVTPIQRRISFGEYGMELCSKVLVSECTFSDWVKQGAGTTTLPSYASGVIITPTGAPRYISPDNSRFARRLSFLRFNDIYKDGNQQLILARSCSNNSNLSNDVSWPMPIGVQNGDNAATGFTYPQVMGNLSTPFSTSNNSSYGTVPCPESIASVELGYIDRDGNYQQGDHEKPEGRRRDQSLNQTLNSNSGGSLETQIGSKTLPAVQWGTGNNSPGDGTVTNSDGSVTNSDDNNDGVALATGSGNRSNNNAVYRRFNFGVKLNNRAQLAAGQSVRVKVTLFPVSATAGGVGSPFPYAQYIFTPTVNVGNNTINTPLGSIYEDGDVVRFVGINGGTLPAPLVANTDYLIFDRAGNRSNFKLSATSGVPAAIDLTSSGAGTIGITQVVLPTTTPQADYINRFYNGVGAEIPRLSGVAANSAETVDPESATCPATSYCSVISWTGQTSTTDPDIKVLSVLVVRDSGDEGEEEFRVSLDNLKGSAAYADSNPGASSTTRNKSLRRGLIQNDRPNQPACTSGLSSNNNDDQILSADTVCPTPTPIATATPIPTETPIATATPTPTPIPTPTQKPLIIIPPQLFPRFYRLSGNIPFSMISPPAADYPFEHAGGIDKKFRPFNPPSSGGSEGGRYVWGNNINNNLTLDAGEDIFPDIPPRSGLAGEIPMLPGDFTQTLTSSSNQMTTSRPSSQDRTLWYRTSNDDGNYIGEGPNIRYSTDKNLFINNLSFPQIGSGAGRANLSSTGALVLPNTPCINLVDGTVDELCISKTYFFDKNATYPLGTTTSTATPDLAGTTTLNLNLPYNPHFPSANASQVSENGNGTEPASSFVVCGATGKSHNYQAIERPAISKTDISSGSCDQATDKAGGAIRTFVGTLPIGTAPNLTGGTGILSAKLFPGSTGDAFVGIPPSVSGNLAISISTTTSPPIISNPMTTVLRATNTYANNKVHVYNVNNLGTLNSGVRVLNGTLTFRANCVNPSTGAADDPCTPTSVRRGPSPVFIMRGAPDESIEFSGLKIVLDGVDPNNILWVSSRTQARIEFKSTKANATSADQAFLLDNSPSGPNAIDAAFVKVGRRIAVSANPAPPVPLVAGDTYYIVAINGSGKSAKLWLSQLPPPAIALTNPSYCVPSNKALTVAAGCPAIVNVDIAGILKLSSEPSFIFSGGTTLNPNLITGATTPSIITSNFLGSTSNISTTTLTEDNTSVFAVKDKFSSFRGVRFLGLFGDSSKINNETLFVAMTSVDQPSVLPVMQLQVPNATSGSDSIPLVSGSGMNGTPSSNKGQWMIRPTAKTEVNVYFVAGSTPSRAGVPYTSSSTLASKAAGTNSTGAQEDIGETGGGLANFVRLLENWENIPIKIAGGFIQNTKSRFATAPFFPMPLSNGTADALTVFMNPVQPGTGVKSGQDALSSYDLRYTTSTGGSIPYYTPAIRLWGYDVGLLTQQPDRFAERFAVPISGANEYFREVSSDDAWVETLLCALEPTDPIANRTGASSPKSYTKRTLRGSDLRTACNNAKYGTTTAGNDPAISYTP